MRIPRRGTIAGTDPYCDLTFKTITSKVSDQKGVTAFEQLAITVPTQWSQVASDILATKYFRRTGVAKRLRRVAEPGVPAWLWRSVPDEAALADLPEADRFCGESDARQVFDRLGGAMTYWGWRHGYFDGEADALAFFDEIRHTLVEQMVAPNSPHWFNAGLHWAYGIEGPAQGHYFVDQATDVVETSGNAFERPQTHSCFIQSVHDELVRDGGILPLIVDEARIAKFGSGTGANFSDIRGASEPLSGGGHACGLLAVLRASDRAAALVTAGGSTRRASKMVVVDIDHPDIEAFIRWKADEERKVAALIAGSRTCHQHLTAVMRAVMIKGQAVTDPVRNPGLRRALRQARKAHVPENYLRRALQTAAEGHDSMDFPVFNGEWDQEAYATVAGQNANNTVRVTNAFMQAVEAGDTWSLVARRTQAVAKTVPAADLWGAIGHAAWASADPGLHFADTINEWHTCPETDSIRASNSCSEFVFLNDTGATLASVNLLRFKTAQNTIDLDGLEHVARLWMVALDISVSMSQFPSAAIARRTHDYRPLGLGYANLGGLLMHLGIPYDSTAARALCGGLTAVLSGAAYAQSAAMAKDLGPFRGYAANREPMLRVIRNHCRAALGLDEGYERVSMPPVPLAAAALAAIPRLNGTAIALRAQTLWTEAVELGTAAGFRNAQATCIAPTGTIGLVMDCDTTGIEPDFAIVKFKKLSSGGYFKIVNHAARAALATLGYDARQIDDMEHHALGHGSLTGAPFINPESLKARGFTEDKIAALERALPAAFDMQFVFNRWTLGEDFLTETLQVTPEQLAGEFNLLRHLGFSTAEIEAANIHVCGAMTLEGAPHLREEHLAVFDCANPCGRTGTRFLSPESHIRMMAAAQPFLSGAISKTVNMPGHATVEECKRAFLLSWKLGLKANAIYRNGSKLSQPLSSHREIEGDEWEEPGFDEAIATEAKDHRRPAVAHDGAVRRVPHRRDVPVRPGLRHAVMVDGQRVVLQTGLSATGDLVEISIESVDASGRADPFAGATAVALSVGLQHGIPLSRFIDAYGHGGTGPDETARDQTMPGLLQQVFAMLGAKPELRQESPSETVPA